MNDRQTECEIRRHSMERGWVTEVVTLGGHVIASFNVHHGDFDMQTEKAEAVIRTHPNLKKAQR